MSEPEKHAHYVHLVTDVMNTAIHWELAVGGTGLPDGVHIFIPKIPIWVPNSSGGPWNDKCLYSLGMAIGNILHCHLIFVW
jgi:hypothetical protein